MKFSWKRWKMGLFMSFLSGVLTGLLSAAIGMDAKEVCLSIGIAVAKDGLLYLKQHPIDSIEDTTITSRVVTDGAGVETKTETKTIKTTDHKES